MCKRSFSVICFPKFFQTTHFWQISFFNFPKSDQLFSKTAFFDFKLSKSQGQSGPNHSHIDIVWPTFYVKNGDVT